VLAISSVYASASSRLFVKMLLLPDVTGSSHGVLEFWFLSIIFVRHRDLFGVNILICYVIRNTSKILGWVWICITKMIKSTVCMWGTNLMNKFKSFLIALKLNVQIQIIRISWYGNKINLRANKLGVHWTTATNAGLSEHWRTTKRIDGSKSTATFIDF